MAKQMTYWWAHDPSNPPIKPNRILAIDPGTRYNGIAVLDGPELVYYAIKTLNRPTSRTRIVDRAREIVREMVGAYGPAIVAIEQPFIHHASAHLLPAIAEMKREAHRLGAPVQEYLPTTIRRYVCHSPKATKLDVAAAVADLFPELKRHLNYVDEWTQKYYSNMFDAIAVGLACQQHLKDRGVIDESLTQAA